MRTAFVVRAARSDRPVFIPDPSEPIMRGIPMPEGTELEQARKRWVIEHATATLLRTLDHVEAELEDQLGDQVELRGILWSRNNSVVVRARRRRHAHRALTGSRHRASRAGGAPGWELVTPGNAADRADRDIRQARADRGVRAALRRDRAPPSLAARGMPGRMSRVAPLR